LNNIILLRYGELFLKGNNKAFFERQLRENIRHALSDFNVRFSCERSRYTVSNYNPLDEGFIVSALKRVFGLHSLSIAKEIDSEPATIFQECVKLLSLERAKTFRITTNRADKRFPYDTMQMNREAGAYVLENVPSVRVDLHNPELNINIDIRENGKTFVFSKTVQCAGGMPVGSAGRGLLMLSGGIDSPVAGYMMMKRGLRLDALHFASPPYTSESAKQKVIDLAGVLKRYNGTCGTSDSPRNKNADCFCLHIVPFTKIQEEIRDKCSEKYAVIIMRRIMMKIANMIAKNKNCRALITGEALGQVASQTLESITVTDSVSRLPVLRPLIGFDKEEIITISKQMDAYNISIRPHDDCCTVFVPKHPVTKPCIERTAEEEAGISNELVEEAVRGVETVFV
jgi:thiamine biosynthesis protein ThiI